MKKYISVLSVAAIAFACSAPKTITETYQVDDYYILMSDAYHLNPGMTYEAVKETLKQDPYEVHQNVEDKCIVLSYHVKRNERIHEDIQEPIPLVFYNSENKSNLTYSAADLFYVILDTKEKKVRTYFSQPNAERIEKYNMLLRRSKMVCEDPSSSEKFMSLWDEQESEETSEVSDLFGGLGAGLLK